MKKELKTIKKIKDKMSYSVISRNSLTFGCAVYYNKNSEHNAWTTDIGKSTKYFDLVEAYIDQSKLNKAKRGVIFEVTESNESYVLCEIG